MGMEFNTTDLKKIQEQMGETEAKTFTVAPYVAPVEKPSDLFPSPDHWPGGLTWWT